MRQFLTVMVRSVRSTPIHEAILGIQLSLANGYRELFILPLISYRRSLNLPISPQRRRSRYSITVFKSLGQHMLTKFSAICRRTYCVDGRHHLKVCANDPPTHEHSLVKSQQEAKKRERTKTPHMLFTNLWTNGVWLPCLAIKGWIYIGFKGSINWYWLDLPIHRNAL